MGERCEHLAARLKARAQPEPVFAVAPTPPTGERYALGLNARTSAIVQMPVLRIHRVPPGYRRELPKARRGHRENPVLVGGSLLVVGAVSAAGTVIIDPFAFLGIVDQVLRSQPPHAPQFHTRSERGTIIKARRSNEPKISRVITGFFASRVFR